MMLAGDLTQRVAGTFGMAEGLAFGRGGAALYALFVDLARRQGAGEIIVPAICCETVALAALYAGHDVRIADVSSKTLCLTPSTAAAKLSPRTRAVLVVHIFGVDADAQSFAALRSERPDVAFIEDIAHAAGGHTPGGGLLGRALDYTLLSFARDKILPGDGGMLLAAKAGNLTGAAAAMPARGPSPQHDQLALSLRNAVHALADQWRLDQHIDTAPTFGKVAGDYRDLIAYGGAIGDAQALSDALNHLEETRQRRWARHRRYQGIAPDRAVTLPLHDGSMCWRSTLLLDTPARARTITAVLRASRVHASNHYFPLNKLFGGSCPVAEGAASRILNLWVSDDAGDDMIARAIDIITARGAGHG